MCYTFGVEWVGYFYNGEWIIHGPTDTDIVEYSIYILHAATSSILLLFWLFQVTLGYSNLNKAKPLNKKFIK